MRAAPPLTMAGPPGPREARPEDKLHDPATQRARVGGRKGFTSLADARWLGGRLKGGHGEGYDV